MPAVEKAGERAAHIVDSDQQSYLAGREMCDFRQSKNAREHGARHGIYIDSGKKHRKQTHTLYTYCTLNTYCTTVALQAPRIDCTATVLPQYTLSYAALKGQAKKQTRKLHLNLA